LGRSTANPSCAKNCADHRLVVPEEPDALEVVGADVEEAQPIGPAGSEPFGWGSRPAVDRRRRLARGSTRCEREDAIGIRVPDLAWLEHEERSVKTLRQFVAGLAVRVIDERAGAW
jgi:hypothetical protein